MNVNEDNNQKSSHHHTEYLSGTKYLSKWENLKYRLHYNISRIFNDEEYLTKKLDLSHDYLSIKDLIPTVLYDETNECFINEETIGFVLEGNCISNANQDIVKTITNFLSSDIPEGTVVQITNIASPKVDTIFNNYKNSRTESKEIYQTLSDKRIDYFKQANWNSIFKQPYIIRDFKLIISVSIPIHKQSEDNNIIYKVKDKLQNNNITKLFAKDKDTNHHNTTNQYQEKLNHKAESLNKLKSSITSTLKSAGIFLQEHKEADLIKYLDEIINPNRINEERFPLRYRKDSPIYNQVAKGNNILAVEQNHLSLYADDRNRKVCVKSFNAKTYPSHFALWQGIDLIGEYYNDLSQIPCPFITTFTIRIPNNIQSKHSKMQAKALRAMQQAETTLAKYMPELKEKSQDFSFVTKHIREGQKLVETYFQVTLMSPPEMLEEASQILTSIYKKKSFQLVSEKYLQLQSYMSIIPFSMGEGLFNDLQKGNRTDTMLTWTCSNLMPLLGEEYGYTSSPCMLLFGRRGQPLFWNPFANKGGNYNTAVVGKSGSGKSVFMQELVTSLLSLNGKVYVVDDGRSFMNTCKLQEGAFMEFVNGAGVCINPFSLLKDIPVKMKKMNDDSVGTTSEDIDDNHHYNIEDVLSNKEGIDDVDNTSEILILINTMVRQMARSKSSTNEIENSYISSAIDEAYRLKGNKATITLVRDILDANEDNRAKDIALMLRPFTKDGEYKEYFEGECNIKIESFYMVFELSEIKNKKDLQGIVMQFIMFLVFQQMYMGDRKQSISIVIDEAWDLLHGEETGKFIEGLARRARKYNGNIITGTQSINDYYKTSATKAIIENSDWTCLLSQKPESIQAFKESGRIMMDEVMEKTLKSIRTLDKQYSEVMICGNGGYMVGRLIVDPYSIALYSSKAEDFNKIQELTRRGYSVAESLDIIIGNNAIEDINKESRAFLIDYLLKLKTQIKTNPYLTTDGKYEYNSKNNTSMQKGVVEELGKVLDYLKRGGNDFNNRN